MNNRPKINLTSCQQNWEDMKLEKNGRYCDLCDKTVIDFTGMSLYEIENYSKDKKDLCGAFTVEQLEPDLIGIDKLISPFKKMAIVFLSFINYEIAATNLSTNSSGKTTTTQSITPPIKQDSSCQNSPAPFIFSTNQNLEEINTIQSVNLPPVAKGGFYFSKRFPFVHYRKRRIVPGGYR